MEQITDIGGINPKHITLPSNVFLNSNEQNSINTKNQKFLQNIPPQLQGFVKDALDKGAPMEAIQARIKEMNQRQENR